LRNVLDRSFERLNRRDEAAKREKPEQTGDEENREVGDEYLRSCGLYRIE
jgi:hypothetical protein